MKIPLLTALLFVALSSYGQSTDLHPMLYSSPMSYNPAFTGYTGSSRMTAQYFSYNSEYDHRRNGDYMAGFSYDTYLNKPGIGLGVSFSHETVDAHGGIIPAFYSLRYDKSFNKAGMFISKTIIHKKDFALLFASGVNYFDSRYINEDESTFFGLNYRRRPIDDFNPVENPKTAKGMDVSAGFLAIHKKVIFGMAVSYLNEPEFMDLYGETFKILRLHNGHFTYQYTSPNKKIGYAVSFNVFLQEGLSGYGPFYYSAALGNTFKYKWARLGIKLRDSGIAPYNSLIFYAGYQGKTFSVSAAASRNMNYGSVYSGNLCLSYVFKRKEGKQQLQLPQLIDF